MNALTEEINILFTESEIQCRIKEISSSLNQTYANNENIVVIGVMSGAINFTIDLAKELNYQIIMDWISISSYRKGDTQGELLLLKDIEIDIENKHLIVVEDILDSGRTLNFINDLLKARKPKSIKFCVLLNKVGEQKVPFTPDYIGFNVNDVHWVGGYGIDFNQRYRNLRDIYKIHITSTS